MRTLAQSLAVFIPLFLAISVNTQTPTDFTGHWRQQNESGSQRQLDIEPKWPELARENHGYQFSRGTRRLEVKYVIGGPETSYKGLDGDEFRSSVRWDGSTLVFDTVEHEDGRDIPEKTVWALTGDRPTHTSSSPRQSAKSAKTTPSLTILRPPALKHSRGPNPSRAEVSAHGRRAPTWPLDFST